MARVKPAPLRLEHEGRSLILAAQPEGVSVELAGLVLLRRTVPWPQVRDLAAWLGVAIAWKEGA